MVSLFFHLIYFCIISLSFQHPLSFLFYVLFHAKQLPVTLSLSLSRFFQLQRHSFLFFQFPLSTQSVFIFCVSMVPFPYAISSVIPLLLFFSASFNISRSHFILLFTLSVSNSAESRGQKITHRHKIAEFRRARIA